MSTPRPHTTTVRFPRDVWVRVTQASAREGVAAAQYIREATIARLAAGDQAETERSWERRQAAVEQRLGRIERVLAALLRR